MTKSTETFSTSKKLISWETLYQEVMRGIDEGRNTITFRVRRRVHPVKRWVPVPVDKEICVFICKYSFNTHITQE